MGNGALSVVQRLPLMLFFGGITSWEKLMGVCIQAALVGVLRGAGCGHYVMIPIHFVLEIFRIT